uniref:Uncharacterized protein n=1 Tax=Kuenenia stuttgartiensis TaxID=174633 RepID=Q1Q3X6_KUEST|nr:unknown protein [Candidatus Kuenenia stuttgartiensis]
MLLSAPSRKAVHYFKRLFSGIMQISSPITVAGQLPLLRNNEMGFPGVLHINTDYYF